MPLTRRELLRTSFAAGTATLLLPVACAPADESADGSLERPFTEADPGPWAAEAAIHQPVVWAGRVDARRTRLWIEMADEATGETHEQVDDHYVTQIKALVEDTGRSIFDRAFLANAEARVVAPVTIPPEATRIAVLAHCNRHGWWKRVYEVAQLAVEPVGDARRPYTYSEPGPWPDKIEAHVPKVYLRDGGFVIEVGDRAAGKLHETTPEHYIEQIVILNQESQVVTSTALGAAYGEPAIFLALPAGTGQIRVIAWCNQHGWWESEYVVPD